MPDAKLRSFILPPTASHACRPTASTRFCPRGCEQRYHQLLQGEVVNVPPTRALTRGAAEAAQSIGVMLLEDIRRLLVELGLGKNENDWIASKSIAGELAKLEGRPWPEFGRQKKPITQNAIARLLKPFRVEPTDPRHDPTTGEQGRGYWVSVLQEVFRRYLPSSSPQDPPHNRRHVENADTTDVEATFQTVVEDGPATVVKMPSDADAIDTCNASTVVNPPLGEKAPRKAPPNFMNAVDTALRRHGVFVHPPDEVAEIKAVRIGLLQGTYCGRRSDLDAEFDRQLEAAIEQGLVVTGEINGMGMAWLPIGDGQ